MQIREFVMNLVELPRYHDLPPILVCFPLNIKYKVTVFLLMIIIFSTPNNSPYFNTLIAPIQLLKEEKIL